MKHHRHRARPIVGTADVRARVPGFARLFTPATDDEIRFAGLQPLVPGSPWSAVALISPSLADHSGGIVCQRRHLAAGSNAFTLCLRDGVLVAQAGAETRSSRLTPPLGQWSRVGVGCDASGTRFYLGAGDAVSTEDLPGLTANSCPPGTPLVIGLSGNNFAGAIGLVCLFAERLPEATMQAICVGRVDPCFAPKLCFAWLAFGAGDIDMVSRHAAAIVGTKVVAFGAIREAAPASPRPPEPRRVEAPPEPEPPVAPPLSTLLPPLPQAARTPHSSLFQELGLEPKEED